MGKDVKMDDPVKKTKKKMWKVCRCGCGWMVFGGILLAVGIALLVTYADYWSKDQDWQRGLAYVGVAFICLGFLLAAIGITFCVILFIVFRRMNADHGTKTMFHPPKYEYGEAPYPQQPPFNPDPTDSTAVVNSSNSAQPANPGEVRVEIKEHTKF